MIEELYHLAFDALRGHLRTTGMPFTEDDGDLLFAGHRLGLSIAFEGFERQGGQIIAPLDVQIHLEGDLGDRFRVGTLGIGADRAAAQRDGINEWHLLAASPVLAALGAPAGTRKKNDATPKQLAGWDFFPGRIGIRGRIPDELTAGGGMLRTLLQALQKHVSNWPLPEKRTLRSIFVMANSVDGAQQVQAAVDGFLNEELTAAISTLTWPAGGEPYFFKQLFVLAGGR